MGKTLASLLLVGGLTIGNAEIIGNPQFQTYENSRRESYQYNIKEDTDLRKSSLIGSQEVADMMNSLFDNRVYFYAERNGRSHICLKENIKFEGSKQQEAIYDLFKKVVEGNTLVEVFLNPSVDILTIESLDPNMKYYDLKENVHRIWIHSKTIYASLGEEGKDIELTPTLSLVYELAELHDILTRHDPFNEISKSREIAMEYENYAREILGKDRRVFYINSGWNNDYKNISLEGMPQDSTLSNRPNVFWKMSCLYYNPQGNSVFQKVIEVTPDSAYLYHVIEGIPNLIKQISHPSAIKMDPEKISKIYQYGKVVEDALLQGH